MFYVIFYICTLCTIFIINNKITDTAGSGEWHHTYGIGYTGVLDKFGLGLSSPISPFILPNPYTAYPSFPPLCKAEKYFRCVYISQIAAREFSKVPLTQGFKNVVEKVQEFFVQNLLGLWHNEGACSLYTLVIC